MQPPIHALNPYLTVNGASDAIAFYQKAFGATEDHRAPAQDGKRLMHAQVTINGCTLMMSDEFPEFGPDAMVRAPTKENPPPVAIALHYKTPAEVDAIYERAVGAGCTSTMKPEDTFWNARFAMLTDPFGHRWMLNAPLPPK